MGAGARRVRRSWGWVDATPHPYAVGWQRHVGDVGGNVAEWVGEVATDGFFSNLITNIGAAQAQLKEAVGPAGSYASVPSPQASSSYPSNVIVEAGALAVVEGQNFSSGTIWVRSGGTLFIRGSNFQGDVYLEAGAMWINSGSNIYTGSIVRSANTMVTGGIGTNVTIAEASYEKCGGTCPANVQRFTADNSRGLGWALIYGTPVTVRGGKVGLGPVGGVFTASANALGAPTGFRCVRAPSL